MTPDGSTTSLDSNVLFTTSLQVCALAAWHPGIGDPTWIGWITTVSYVFAAMVCAGASRLDARAPTQASAQGSNAQKRHSLLWISLAIAMMLLAVNKQLDLQTLATEVARDLARAQGWYEQRRHIQRWFAVCAVGLASLGAVLLGVLAHRQTPPHQIALLGCGLLLAFVLVRTLVIERFDLVRGRQWVVLVGQAWCELSGIGCVAFGALLQIRGRFRLSKKTPALERSKGTP